VHEIVVLNKPQGQRQDSTMGYEIDSSANITFTWDSEGQNPLDVAVTKLLTADLLDDYEDGVEGWARAVAAAVAEALGATEESPTVQIGDGRVDIMVSASSRAPDADRVLNILAESGATGAVECCGEDDALWRWRLADGALHDDAGRILYAGDVDTTGWVVQLQAVDDHDLDRVAIVATEHAGIPLLAQWCRDAIAAHVADGVIPVVDLADLNDDIVVDLWARTLGGVRYSIRPVTGAA
jgi:hypothetical protein